MVRTPLPSSLPSSPHLPSYNIPPNPLTQLHNNPLQLPPPLPPHKIQINPPQNLPPPHLFASNPLPNPNQPNLLQLQPLRSLQNLQRNMVRWSSSHLQRYEMDRNPHSRSNGGIHSRDSESELRGRSLIGDCGIHISIITH